MGASIKYFGKSYIALLGLMLYTLFVFFYGLGAYPLLDNNDGLYAQIAREMLDGGDYILPHLNGGLYLEKPPLLYWMVALTYKVAGVSEITARFIPALAGVGCVTIVYWGLLELGLKEKAIQGAFILSSSVGLLIFSRMVYFDVLLTLWLTAALLCFLIWWMKETKTYLRLFYLFLALALLTKGFIALILVGGVIGLFWIIEKCPMSVAKAFFDIRGIALFFLIALPWHVLAMSKEPEFFNFYVINEHILRFLDLREPRDYYRGPFYYYIPRLLLYFVPWTILIFFMKFQRIEDRQEKISGHFFMVWAGVFFVFFTLSRAKANYYIVTMMPPVAMMIGVYCASKRWVNLFASGLIIITITAAAFIVPHYEDKITNKKMALILPKEADQVYFFRDYEKMSSLRFYLNRAVKIIDSQSNDLLFAKRKKHVDGLFITLEEFKNKTDFSSLWVYVFHEQQKAFQEMFPQFRMIKNNKKVYLFTNHPVA